MKTVWPGLALVLLIVCVLFAQNQPPRIGPATEKRFPPLRVPAGFSATLFACDPLVAYPSVIAAGPKPGSLFVAVDYMTGLGTDIVRRDEIRLIEDTDSDGYADKATVFATGFNSIQGLVYHDGIVYVMHSPYLTALRDPKNTGKATVRTNLLTGLGLAPEVDQIRLHNANAVVVGHDGFLYLAMGDRGIDVKRPEGDRLVLNGGGILRCRPDGRDLHVFSRGLRNVYDVSLDEDLNVFLRDNENDGGRYKIRVCHSFFGADHGYPYLYDERPDEALPPLADLGLGSSAGGVCYLETQFPAEYRGSLLNCEWGRAVVRYPLKRAGSSFASAKEIEFASGATSDPYGFKPTDLVVDRDGSLFISDWADGQRPKRGRGRIYRVRYQGKDGDKQPIWSKEKPLPARLEDVVARLDGASYSERCRAQQAIDRRGKEGVAAVEAALKKGTLGVRGRLHAVWVLARSEGAIEKLFALAKADKDARIQAQSIRAIAGLADPVLAQHKLAAGRGDVKLARRLAGWGAGKASPVLLEVVVALGRLRWVDAPGWLRDHIKKPDTALAHAAQWTLRRADNWPAVLKLLDGTDPWRDIARRAIAEQYDAGLVDGLIARLAKQTDSAKRQEFADRLALVYKKPGSWTYWGFRQASRPANTVSWKKSDAIEQALNKVLAQESNRTARLAILRRLLREKVSVQGKALSAWLKTESDAATMAVLLGALRGRPGNESRSDLEAVIRNRRQTPANRLLAATLFVEGLDADSEDHLLPMAEAIEDGPILAVLLRAVGTRKVRAASKLLLEKLSSKDALVRASAAEALANLALKEAHKPIQKLLSDPDVRVRTAAVLAAGKLNLRPAVGQLLKLARDPSADVRRASLEALRQLREPRALAVALAALNDEETTLPALACVASLGGPGNAPAVSELARRRPAAEILAATGKTLASWAGRDGKPADRMAIEKALAEIHGSSGVLLGWHVRGPLTGDAAETISKLTAGKALPTGPKPAVGWKLVRSAGIDVRVRLGQENTAGTWLAYSEMLLSEQAKVEFFTTSSAPTTVWLNGKVVHKRDRPAVPGPYPERFEATLAKGINRVIVRLTGVKTEGEFTLRFRRKSAVANHERLALSALSRAGNPGAGRKLFMNVEKSLCLKCHRVGDKGERIGPELTGLGSRFSKAHIVEAILEPGRTVSPSFETIRVELKNGKVITGVKIAETETSITLADNEAKKHVITRDSIEAVTKQPGSAMPDGLEKRLSEDEFVDLVSYLVSLRQK